MVNLEFLNEFLAFLFNTDVITAKENIFFIFFLILFGWLILTIYLMIFETDILKKWEFSIFRDISVITIYSFFLFLISTLLALLITSLIAFINPNIGEGTTFILYIIISIIYGFIGLLYTRRFFNNSKDIFKIIRIFSLKSLKLSFIIFIIIMIIFSLHAFFYTKYSITNLEVEKAYDISWFPVIILLLGILMLFLNIPKMNLYNKTKNYFKL